MVAADARTAIAFALSPGNAHDAPEGCELLWELPRMPEGLPMLMDRAYEGDVKGGVKPDQWGGVTSRELGSCWICGECGVWSIAEDAILPGARCAGWVGLLGRRSGVGGTAFVPALLKAIAVAVHLQDVDMVGEAVEQSTGEALGTEDLGPLLEGQVAGDQG